MVGFHRLRTCSFHVQTNGKVKRIHSVLKASLKTRCGDWQLSLPLVILALLAMLDKDGISSFLLVTGKATLFPIFVFYRFTCTYGTSFCCTTSYFYHYYSSSIFAAHLKFAFFFQYTFHFSFPM